MTTLTAGAPAKINLFLDVLGKRSDGYHEIETVFYPLTDLADTIMIETDQAPEGTIICDDPAVPLDADNTCRRAAEAFVRAAGLPVSWRITIAKRIPVAAGLGGGSADAATVLLLLNQAHGNCLSIEALREIAVSIGADVSFFLDASCPALARGIGEKLEQLAPSRPLPLVLLCPGFPVSAAWAYANLDRVPRPSAPVRAAEFAAALQKGPLEELASATYNALEYAVLDKFPLVEMLRDFLMQAGALCAHVSGSGPTVFGLFNSPVPSGLADRARETFGPSLVVWSNPPPDHAMPV